MTILVSEGYFLKVMLHWQAKCGLHDDIIQKHLLSSSISLLDANIANPGKI